MEDKKAIVVLKNLLGKHSLNSEEKEAVLTAIGVLGWTSLSKGRMESLIKARKAKRDKSVKWG